LWDPPGLNANASTAGVFDDDDDDDSRGERVIIGIESDLREEEEDVGDIGGDDNAIGKPVAEVVDDEDDEAEGVTV
jgi:hypothetical protein